MNKFLSCDWGTSSFRLSLVNTENFSVIVSESTDKGILSTYNQWNETRKADPATRLSYYLDVIKDQVTALENQAGQSMNGIPLLVSGMASSSIGMMPLPYHELPFATDGSEMLQEYIAQTPEFKHDILLISGVCSYDDVMRGEETQLIGLVTGETAVSGDRLYIFPGTHSKHIVVNGKQVVGFKTYMTGEFFDLLSKKSILHAGVEKEDGFQSPGSKSNFEKAVKEGAGSNLLNSCFRVRTNDLFGKLSKKENFHYLSGLLIGAELGEIAQNDTIGIYLCCGTHLKTYYETALQVLGLKEKVHSFSAEDVEKAALKGQYKIYENHNKR